MKDEIVIQIESMIKMSFIFDTTQQHTTTTTTKIIVIIIIISNATMLRCKKMMK